MVYYTQTPWFLDFVHHLKLKLEGTGEWSWICVQNAKGWESKACKWAWFADVFFNSWTLEMVSIQWANFMTSHKAWGEVDLTTRCTTCICANTMRGKISRPTYDLLQAQRLNPCKWTLSYCYHGKSGTEPF
jgi:hypothetical protein